VARVGCAPHPYGGTGNGCGERGLRAAPVRRHRERVWLARRTRTEAQEAGVAARRTRTEAQGAGAACAPHHRTRTEALEAVALEALHPRGAN